MVKQTDQLNHPSSLAEEEKHDEQTHIHENKVSQVN